MRTKKPKFKNADYISYDRQTRTSWAILLNSYEDVPVDFLPFFQSLEKSEKSFPYSVITPSYEGFVNRTQQRLVCLMDDCLYVANKGETALQSLCLKIQDIQHIEFRTVLLDSHIQFTGLDREGNPARVYIRFNSVSDTLFKYFVNSIRQTNKKYLKVKDDYSLNFLESVNFKMANFTRHCLLPEEKIDQVIWQSELRQSKIRIHIPLLVNSIFYRTVFPHHVTMLTDQELILIRESDRIVSNDTYGGIWEYVPLDKILDASINQDEEGFLTLTIMLPNAQQLETRYLPSQHKELELLVETLEKLKQPA